MAITSRSLSTADGVFYQSRQVPFGWLEQVRVYPRRGLPSIINLKCLGCIYILHLFIKGLQLTNELAEHHVLYQYNLAGARDHYIGLMQTETVNHRILPCMLVLVFNSFL
jgi:hypothetical protein